MNVFTILKGIKKTNKILNEFMDKQIKRFNLSGKNIIIGGFSQGAMMTIYTGLRRKEKPMFLISFSGMPIDTIETLQKDILSRPDVCLIHGNRDSVVPYDSLEKFEELLREVDVPHISYTIDDMGHEINDESLDKVKEFIENVCNKY
jgi:phospholipase/carboxylesterase